MYLVIFLYLQPGIDIITSLMVHYTDIAVTLGIVVRMLVLIVVLYEAIVILRSDKHKYIVGYMILIVLYIALYLLNSLLTKGTMVLFTEIKALAKMLYFPVMLVALLYIFWQKDETLDNKHLFQPGLIYASLILIAVVTNTSFLSYGHGKLGGTGWFYAPNEVGAILSILFPVYIYSLIKNPQKMLYWFMLPIYLFVCLWIGTKVPMLAVIITLV